MRLRTCTLARWHFYPGKGWDAGGKGTFEYLQLRSRLPNHVMSDPPFDQEGDEVERAYCSVRMNDGRGGFKWSYHGEGCLDRAEDMAKWVRTNPEEWVHIRLADGAIKWYSLRQVSTVEVWHDPAWTGDAQETPGAPMDIEEEVSKLYADLEQAEREGI